MKSISKFFILPLILFTVFTSCKKLNIKEFNNYISNKSVFSPALKKEILKMIKIKNKEMKGESFQSKICNVVVFQDNEIGSHCFVTIGLGTNVVQNTIRFIPLSDTLKSQINTTAGYTFLENELICCCIMSRSCSNMLIDEKKLIPVNDSIPGYPNVLNHDSDSDYDVPMRIYQLINADSLQLVKSLFITPVRRCVSLH